MRAVEEQLIKCMKEEPAAPDGQTSVQLQCLDMFSSIVTESFYILDIPQKRFCYVKPDDFFLCGFSAEDALEEGYDFYSKIIYPEDLLLWTDIHEAILHYTRNSEESRDEIDYFSCAFRLQRNYSFLPSRPLAQMIYQRMKPVWIDNKLCYLACAIKISTIKEAGNLQICNKDGLTYKEYNFMTKRWKQKTKEQLTERERAILMLAEQGKSSGEIAGDLCKGKNTIRNQIKALFSKLKVHSMQEAIEIACYRCVSCLKGKP